MARLTKKDIYARYGIEFKDGKILSPIGWIEPLLKDGNSKLGKNVGTWSMLPTNRKFTHFINGIEYTIDGTCCCCCEGCYATKGRYNFGDVFNSLFCNTFLARGHLDFVERAIMAQIEAENIDMLRIHAAGDFFSTEYIAMWHRIMEAFPSVDIKGSEFWTYTKYEPAQHAFDDIVNCNVVPSITPYGINYGHCDYILWLYNKLLEDGQDVYICRCGIDKNTHCNICHGCTKHKYVLFIEHSTSYKAEKDPMFATLKAVIEAQQDGKGSTAQDRTASLFPYQNKYIMEGWNEAMKQTTKRSTDGRSPRRGVIHVLLCLDVVMTICHILIETECNEHMPRQDRGID